MAIDGPDPDPPGWHSGCEAVRCADREVAGTTRKRSGRILKEAERKNAPLPRF